MKTIFGLASASAAALSLFALVGATTPGARAGEFCSTDSSGMRGCGYTTLEQCQVTQSGKNGTCARDPFYEVNNANPRNALAYQPAHSVKHSHALTH
jgi:hypothetical protein